MNTLIKTLGLLTIFFFSPRARACCSEQLHHLYPVGEQQGEPVFISFDLFRRCQNKNGKKTAGKPGLGEGNEFWIKGDVHLVRWLDGTMKTLEVLGTIDSKECSCTYDQHFEQTNYESLIEPFFKRAILQFQNKENPIQPLSVRFNDRKNTKALETEDGFILEYKGNRLDLTEEFFPHCAPSLIRAVRTYNTSRYQINILRASCSSIKSAEILNNTKRFSNLATGFWKSTASPHGVQKDYVFFTPIVK